MKILITGAGGFIGGFMVEKALSLGYQTWAGVRPSTSKEYLQDKSISFIDLPFASEEKLTQALIRHKQEYGRWDVIIHNLGLTKCQNPEDFDKVNYGFIHNFASALIAADMVPQQFIMMSSLSAYGPGDEKNMRPITLSDTPMPNTAYGRSKLKAEEFLKSLQEFPYVIMRPTGVYGPREKDYFLMVKSIKMGFDFSVGYRTQRITFIYVRDLVDCVFRAIERRVIRREYIVSEPRDYSSSDFRRYAQKDLGKKIVIPVKVPLFILKAVSVICEQMARITGKASTLNSDKYKIMKQRNWRCDISAIQQELDYTPTHTLEMGVKESIEWYRNNGWI